MSRRKAMEIGSSQSKYKYSYSSPSFSSSLLDAIYRSIDQGEESMVIEGETAWRKENRGGCGGFRSEEEMANSRRACMIEKWMERKSSEKTAGRRRFAAELQVKKCRKSDRTPESSSWGSSASGGGFSSESEPISLPRPKPVRTSASCVEKEKFRQNHRDSESNRSGRHGDQSHPNPKLGEVGGGFQKTKSRAMKIYGDMKKAKQPISPGRKLAEFLNSIFASPRKPKSADIGNHHSPSPKSTNTSTCSSASSLSKSCLSKTPSSRDKSSSGPKRSVKFSPACATAGNDTHKSAKELKKSHAKSVSRFEVTRNAVNEELMAHMMEKNRHVEVAAMNFLKSYQSKIQNRCQCQPSLHTLRNSCINHRSLNHRAIEDEDDDLSSCGSSDLFELDNLSTIGMMKYDEELPVYETTQLDCTSGVIRNGLVFQS